MFTCASCGKIACEKEEKGDMPKNCPMGTEEYEGNCRICQAYGL